MYSAPDIDRPTKRPRLSYTPDNSEEVPEEFDLPAARARNDSRLKSLFEGIFAKYSQDFTDVGDEIDLQSGKLVVDNGHLSRMQGETDTGAHSPWAQGGDESDDASDAQGAEEHEDQYAVSHSGDLLDDQHETATKFTVNETTADSDFVFTYKASKAPGLSPMAKSEKATLNTTPKPQDSIWQVPDLPQTYATPTTGPGGRKVNIALTPQIGSARSPSPPGSGSIWAIAKRGRPRTEGKPKATPSQRQPRGKRKCHSSPLTSDWSFARIPDGDESDDPLQEKDWASPSPLKMRNIRGKRVQVSDKQGDNLSPRPVCTTSKPDRTYETDGAEQHHDGQSPQETTQKEGTLNDILPDKDTILNPAQAVSVHSAQDTPSKRRHIAPDEAKLIVSMMHKDGKKVNDVVQCLPDCPNRTILNWYYYHWTCRLANPPHLSGPWSQGELAALGRLSNQSGLSWAEIRDEFRNRSLNEIEFHLLRLSVDGPLPGDVDGQEHEEEAEERPEVLTSSEQIGDGAAESPTGAKVPCVEAQDQTIKEEDQVQAYQPVGDDAHAVMKEESHADPFFHSHAAQEAPMEDELMEQQNPDEEPELSIPKASQASRQGTNASAFPIAQSNSGGFIEVDDHISKKPTPQILLDISMNTAI
ncbi:uncharacterized protein N7511_003847 [Penicillium nucicola]|uniref:uncharacterized protein n=1 Tax=Penicillium nucicola TaxID=1850975 RepID=UPI002544E47F|nr:uncharacterized protein N7511_003847 [Penicillium nucicola]KAJ5766231.1 hypothetical protein N7511_003847 [Penicillium nucicola]